ncbi:Hypothetical protein BSSP2_I1366 [Brucella suis bv. 2]|nr:Hypothetical protein BSSP3_I1365 [Brucella suis bv. 2]AIB31578.1 Hypothetical protein BSSP2_I1366 [Brucella suis bv. 2]
MLIPPFIRHSPPVSIMPLSSACLIGRSSKPYPRKCGKPSIF